MNAKPQHPLIVSVEFAKRTLTFVGSSLGATTALFYAAGFIAESARWSYLGSSPLVMHSQQYLRTGGQFFLMLLPCVFTGLAVIAERAAAPVTIVGVLYTGLVAWTYSGRWRNVALLAAEALLLGSLVYCLLFAPTSFLGRTDSAQALSVRTRDLLLRPTAPPPAQSLLLANYSLLLFEYALLLLALLALYLSYRERVRADVLPDAEGAQSTSPHTRWRRSIWLTSSLHRLWPSLHRGTHIVACIFLIVMTLLLPINFAQLLIHGPFPVVALRPEPPMVAEGSTVFLIREDADRYLFFIRGPQGRSSTMWLASKHEVPAMEIVASRRLW